MQIQADLKSLCQTFSKVLKFHIENPRWIFFEPSTNLKPPHYHDEPWMKFGRLLNLRSSIHESDLWICLDNDVGPDFFVDFGICYNYRI